MTPAAWALVAVAVSTVVSVATCLTVEHLTWKRRERRATAAQVAAQPAPATPELDPIDEQIGIAAAVLNPDSIEADVAALIRQAEAHLRREAGDVTDTPIIPGEQS